MYHETFSQVNELQNEKQIYVQETEKTESYLNIDNKMRHRLR